jgi:hypothetical protein
MRTAIRTIRHCALAACGFFSCPHALLAQTEGQELRWGTYVGRYYDTSPSALVSGKNTRFENQYIGAISLSKTLWRSERHPLSIEIEGVAAYQSGMHSLGEFGIVPVVRWEGFPWSHQVPTSLRFGPLGLSWTTTVSPLERSHKGGSQLLNFLIVDLGFSLPGKKDNEIFLRLHHRCSLFNKLNNNGANGEDFLAVGFRHSF